MQTNGAAKRLGWIAVLTGAGFLFSFVFACATPFAALAALAALSLQRGDALTLIGATWAINQIVGYGLLGYPTTWDSYGWGIAIGIAALLATAGAMATTRVFAARTIIGSATAFASAFAIYQLALYAATAVLPAGNGFSLEVVTYVAQVNLLAFGGLLLLQYAGERTGLAALERRSSSGA